MWTLGDASSIDWTQYGPALALAILVIGWLAKQSASDKAENRRLNEMLTRQAEAHAQVLIGLTERFSPLLSDATKTLERTERGMAATLHRSGGDLEQQLELLQKAVQDVARKIEER